MNGSPSLMIILDDRNRSNSVSLIFSQHHFWVDGMTVRVNVRIIIR